MSQAPRSRGRRGAPSRTLTGRNSLGVKVDTSALDEWIDQLGVRAEEAVRPAAAAGAKVIYDRVKLNVAALGTVTGNLQNAIYRTLSEDNSPSGVATYHISWNHIKAPHGHLVEFGYLRRYYVVRTKGGEFRTAIRPEAQGKPRPGRNASQSAKDAYYFKLPSPIQVPGKAFLGSASAVFDEAVLAAEDVFIKHMMGESETEVPSGD